jgi:hypothetical protein
MQLKKGSFRLAPEEVQAIPADPDRTAGVVTLVGGFSVVLSAFVPWIETAVFGISLIRIDLASAVFAALAMISICIGGFVVLRKPATRAVAVVLTVLASAQVGLAIWHLADLVHTLARTDSRLVLINVIGTGLYLGVVASVITLAGGIIAWTKTSSLSGQRERN